eukprot:evm.model.scf_632.4 EVM.evm.TU.scf_632.4   scf_632:48706-50358(-)
MSTVYNLEPPTKGKVILSTTLGEIEIELWAKEAPLATRNFVQLCLEGYYVGTLFHRVIAGFMIQGGDPTGTGKGGESIYGGTFKDEHHSRLKFTHRGLVACANQNRPDSNGSQFFITLDKCEDLNKRYTIFGRVAGDTIYNVLRIGEVEVDGDERPLDAIAVKGTEVVWNPFEDIVPRVARKGDLTNGEGEKPQQQKKKAKKNLTLLSFGEEAREDEEEATAAPAQKICSAHDAGVDDRLVMANTDDEPDEAANANLKHVRESLAPKQEQEAKQQKAAGHHGDGTVGQGGDMSFDAQMRASILARKQAFGASRAGDETLHREAHQEVARSGEQVASKPGIPEEKAPASAWSRLQLKRKALEVDDIKDADLLTTSQVTRAKHKRRKQLHGSREADTLAKLARFTSSLKSGKSSEAKRTLDNSSAATVDSQEPPSTGPQSTGHGAKAESKEDSKAYQGQVLKELDHRAYMPASWRVDDYLKAEEQVGLEDLLNHRLEFAEDANADDEMKRRDDVDDLVVFDPLLEKGKEKYNKRQAQLKRKDREWSKHPPRK